MKIKMEKKQSQNNLKNQPADKKLRLSIYNHIKAGFRPISLCKKLNIKSNLLQYHLSSLKAHGLIKKVGYGTWEILKNYDKTTSVLSTRVANINRLKQKSKTEVLLKPDFVRGHAFQFKLELPNNLKNWKRREEILINLKIPFKKINLFGGAQSLNFENNKIWLTNKSIIIYEKESFISEFARETKSEAINHFLKIIKRLERHLRANFSTHGKYRFKVTRQHYSLIKNALARQYNATGSKLEVYSDKGLWLLIDDSYNLNELETVHSKTGIPDNEKVQNFFNSLKEFPITSKEIFKSMQDTSKNQEIFSQVIGQIDKNLIHLTKVVYKIGENQK